MAQKIVVVCDDDQVMRTIISHILRKKDFSVVLTEDGEKGLAAVAEHTPALLILDMEMPRKGGLQVLADLAAKGGAIPYIIVLSAHESSQKREEALRLGANEFMIKPFSPASLLKRVEELLQLGKI